VPPPAGRHRPLRLPTLRQDRDNLRWYLEDYLEYPIDLAPMIAAQVEQRMAEVGRELFTAIFDSREGWSVWDKIHDQLQHTRIEVVSDVEAAAVLPWELLRDPRTDNPLALDAATFVRAEHETAKHPELGAPGGETIRVLLVICRPAGGRDVPFRSVASHLVPTPATFALLGHTPAHDCRRVGRTGGRTGPSAGDHQCGRYSAAADPAPLQRVGGDLAACADDLAGSPGHAHSADRRGDLHQCRPGP
jgi:hypothetical protein